MNTKSSLQNIPKVLTEHLASAGMTRADLETRTGIPHATMHRRFTNGRFTILELAEIADILGTTTSALVAEAEQVAA